MLEVPLATFNIDATPPMGTNRPIELAALDWTGQ
jgi:hypothetical protein